MGFANQLTTGGPHIVDIFWPSKMDELLFFKTIFVELPWFFHDVAVSSMGIPGS